MSWLMPFLALGHESISGSAHRNAGATPERDGGACGPSQCHGTRLVSLDLFPYSGYSLGYPSGGAPHE
jgi:hypothetical protein